MYRILIALFVFCNMTTSCDYFNEQPIQLIGNLYTWSMEGSNRKSLYLKTSESTYSILDIGGTISVALGNDSLIYIKSGAEQYFNHLKIMHQSGQKIINIKNIDSVDFIKFEQSGNFKYSYYSK